LRVEDVRAFRTFAGFAGADTPAARLVGHPLCASAGIAPATLRISTSATRFQMCDVIAVSFRGQILIFASGRIDPGCKNQDLTPESTAQCAA
jgi:hypothetical protein